MSTTATLATLSDSNLAADPNWWRQASVYQIYPRSFSDSNGDGLGDIKGITAKVPYLKELGIDAVWLSPFYPSALADGGYDVDDYRNVDPKLGTLEDFAEMSAALHDAGIKLIADIVPNHSSDRHEWFKEALAAPKGSAARERYIFRDGLGENGELPPSDWDSVFGGPAWERITEPDGTPGQWYMHIFAKEQPDLNWSNREIRDDFLKTLRFWSDRGVDGFRVDVAHALTKDLTEPLLSKVELTEANTGTDGFPDGSHPFWDRDEVHEIYAEWREVFNEYNPPRTAVAEAWVHATRRARYASPQGLGQAFNFDLLQADFDAEEFQEIITRNLAEANGNRGVLHLGLLQPRRRPARHPVRPAEGRRRPRQGPGRQGLAAGRRPGRGTRRRAGPAPRPCGQPADAGPPGLGLPVPGRGTRPAGSRRDPRRRAPGPVLLPQQGRGDRPRRLPRAAAVGRRGHRRSASVPATPTCRSRNGSAATPWTPRTAWRAPPWSSTARR